MKSIAWAIVFIGLLHINHLENIAEGKSEYSNPQGISVVVAMIGFLISLAL